jgi:hypothetical protein
MNVKPIPGEFKSLIEEKLKSFCGREFVFTKFEQFQRTHSKGYFTVVGFVPVSERFLARLGGFALPHVA